MNKHCLRSLNKISLNEHIGDKNILIICRVLNNIKDGNIKLSDFQLNKLRRYKNTILLLSQPKCKISVLERRKLITQSKFLRITLPIIINALSNHLYDPIVTSSLLNSQIDDDSITSSKYIRTNEEGLTSTSSSHQIDESGTFIEKMEQIQETVNEILSILNKETPSLNTKRLNSMDEIGIKQETNNLHTSTLVQQSNLINHEISCRDDGPGVCPICQKLKSQSNMARHIKSCQNK